MCQRKHNFSIDPRSLSQIINFKRKFKNKTKEIKNRFFFSVYSLSFEWREKFKTTWNDNYGQHIIYKLSIFIYFYIYRNVKKKANKNVKRKQKNIITLQVYATHTHTSRRIHNRFLLMNEMNLVTDIISIYQLRLFSSHSFLHSVISINK